MPEQKRTKGWIVSLVVMNIIFLLIICLLVTVGGVYLFRTQNSVRTQSSPSETVTEKTIEVDGDVVDLVNKTQPAVVTVLVKDTANNIYGDEEEYTAGSGTGFFVSDDGLLITNEHVVCATNTSMLAIVTSDQKTFNVKSIAVDPALDVAILQVDTQNSKVPYLSFADPKEDLKVGQLAIAIGNPLGTNPGSVTKGIISGLNRNIRAQGACNNKTSFKDYEGVIQTDAAINSGNSGGPLINSAGEVIGVNSATSTGANNISYTVPANRVAKVLERYKKNNGKITTPYIGVEYSMISTDQAKTQNLPVGALVRNVVADSPASKGGIQKNDIITKVDDKKVDFSLLSTLSLYFEPGQKVQIEVYRRSDRDTNTQDLGKYVTLDVVVGEK